MSYFEMYLFTRIDSLNVLLGIAMVISGLCLIGWIIGAVVCKNNMLERYDLDSKSQNQYYIAWEVWYKAWTKCIKNTLLIFIPTLLLTILIPTQKEVAAIYLIPKVVNSAAAQELSKLPEMASKILNLKVQEYINDLTPKPKVKE